MVNSSLACHESLSEKLGKQNYFWDVGFHINNYIIQKKTWEIIKPTMEEYLEKFITPASSYYTIDYDSIIKWARRKFSFPFLQPHNKLFFDNLCGTQDSISNMAMRINNIRYISSYVNRGLYIGRHGSHCDDKLFDELRFSGVVLDIIPNDVKEIKSIWDMNLKKEYRNI